MHPFHYIGPDYNDCSNDISNCIFHNKLLQMLQQQNMDEIDCIEMLNCFNHCMKYHDNEFESIYANIMYDMDGAQCDLRRCISYSRNRRRRDEIIIKT